jgi:hypothetical protein
MTYDIAENSNMELDSDFEEDSQKDDDIGTTDEDAFDISPYSILPTEYEREIIINDALDEVSEYMKERALDYKKEDFSEEIIEDAIYGYLCMHFSEIPPHQSGYSKSTSAEADALNNVLESFIRELYDEILERYYEYIAPPRSYTETTNSQNDSDSDSDSENNNRITEKLNILRAKPQPEQRTPEWYLRRNNLITASAASKAFGSQSSVNQLIYEKCKNHAIIFDSTNNDNQAINNLIIEKINAHEDDTKTIDDSNDTPKDKDKDKDTHKVIITTEAIVPPTIQQQQHVSVNSPLHWGQRYEPVTVQLYEYRNKSTLGEFGCIQHDEYSFIGASPDGINVDPTSRLYGRMVEIKNIVNRDITGIPKEEYWVQTQIQMEVCDIDETDFVETRIKEYTDEDSFLKDSPIDAPDSRIYTEKRLEKGIILWFQPSPVKNPNGTGFIYSMPLYEYSPLGLSQEEYEKWEQDIFAKHEVNGCFWVKTIYWYVDQYSCVLIRRNRLWFKAAVPVLQSLWATIEKERKTGCAHRAPKKKTKISGDTLNQSESSGEYVNVVKIDLSTPPPTDTVTSNGTSNEQLKTSNQVSRPSDVLIKCFKIDNLDMVGES